MDLHLTNKIVIVGGASKGIGRSIALGFAQEGAHVALFARNQEALDEVAEEVRALGVKALPVQGDVRKREDVDNLVAQTLEAFGRIDILINNAAFARMKRFGEMDQEDWAVDIDIILYGMFNSVKATLDQMISQKSGKIINVGSDAGSVGEPYQLVYSAAKGGVVAFTKALAKDVARHGILFNTVSAGLTVTEGATRFIGGPGSPL